MANIQEAAKLMTYSESIVLTRMMVELARLPHERWPAIAAELARVVGVSPEEITAAARAFDEAMQKAAAAQVAGELAAMNSSGG